MVPPVLLQDLIHNYSVCKHCSGAVTCLEAVTQRCSVKKVFLEISRNSQENISARASFLIVCLKSFSIARQIDFI